ncbi:hypothetical protein GWZ53_17195 [Vibrio cholerae]|uniref:hypothetical protein n=1 Tax=Vibrio cholerae TaxID=666 RepID=UPI00155F8AF5|nr:hypothetical protein [Vibrio cholerae]NOF82419.1 hypothetical protein [Vibrio cholerae]
MSCKVLFSFLLISIYGVFPAFATDSSGIDGEKNATLPKIPTPPKIPTSNDNELPKGVLQFPYNIYVDNYCIPAKLSLRLIDQDDQHYIAYRPNRSKLGYELYEPPVKDENYKDISDYCGSKYTLLPESQKISLPKSEVNLDHANKFGWQYGALIAPYKYYISNGDLSGGATIAPYFGWRLFFEPINISITPIFFAGPTMVNVEKSDGSDSNVFGVSTGTGLLVELHKEFNMGLVLGYDVVSKNEDFNNNGRPWLSISFGYNFSN